jgi:hypothetical protein
MASNSALIIPPRTNAPAVALTNDIRPIKPPVPVPNPWSWVFASAGVLLLASIVVTAVLAALASRARRAFASPIPSHIRAREAIDTAIHSINDPRAFVTAISTALRSYLEAHFHLRASESTTEEFLRELQMTTELTPPQKQTLATFLDRCDLVKFARFEPNESALRELQDSALRLVHETQYTHTKAARITAEADMSRRSAQFKTLMGRIAAIGGFLSQPVVLILVAAHYIAWLRLAGVLRLQHESVAASRFAFINWIVSTMKGLGSEIIEVLSQSWLIAIPGLMLGMIGLAAIILALTTLRYRAKWFFWAVLIYGILLLGAAPVGAIIGVFLLAFCAWRYNEFFPEPRYR